MAVIPRTKFYEKPHPIVVDKTRAGRIALLGAFDSDAKATKSGDVYTFTPQNIVDLDDAIDKLGDDVTNYPNLSTLPLIFKGASSMLAVDFTVDGDTPDKSISVAKLTQALNTIKEEQFDLIYICTEITDELLSLIKVFCNDRLEDKLPCGFVGVGTRASIPAYTTTKALLPDTTYGFATQRLQYQNEDLSLVETGALYTASIASEKLDTSFTNKTLEGVTDILDEYTFASTDDGYKLVEMGFTVFKMTNRLNGEVKVVNGKQANGLDVYVNRVRDAIIREFNLDLFLGNKSNERTILNINAECARIKNMYIDTLNFIVDVEYNIEKVSPECIDINLTKILFDGVITEIDVYYTIDVQ